LHDLIWVKASAPADTEHPVPVEVRVQPTGQNTLIYDAVVNESWPMPGPVAHTSPLSTRVSNGSERFFSNVPQVHALTVNTFYLRTTPGRLILNSLIYENLFL
jgi:hypothetical protein